MTTSCPWPNPASFRKQFPSSAARSSPVPTLPFHPAEGPAHQSNTGWPSSHKTFPFGTAFRGLIIGTALTRKEVGSQCHHSFILDRVLERTGLKTQHRVCSNRGWCKHLRMSHARRVAFRDTIGAADGERVTLRVYASAGGSCGEESLTT